MTIIFLASPQIHIILAKGNFCPNDEEQKSNKLFEKSMSRMNKKVKNGAYLCVFLCGALKGSKSHETNVIRICYMLKNVWKMLKKNNLV